MSEKLIQLDVLRQVVADQGPVFWTKDVSENERMLRAHPELVRKRNYHSFVGRALSVHRASLGITEIQKDTPRGSRWQKQGGPEP